MEDAYAAKPWLKHYDKNVPEKLDYPSMAYADALRKAFRDFPERVAVHYMGTAIPYRDLDAFSNQFARFLTAKGCRPGDTVGSHLPNIPASYIGSAGIQKAGCVFTGVSPLLTEEELAYQLNDSGAKVLVTVDILFPVASKAVVKTGVKTVVVASVFDYLPQDIPASPVTPLPGIETISFKEAIGAMPTDPVEVAIDPGAPCLMMYTGGTTGPPKGALLTNNNVVHHMVQMNAWVNLHMAEHIVLSAFPMFHQAGNFIVLWSLGMASTLVAIPNPRDLQYIVKAIETYKPTVIVNVPTIFLELMKLPEFRALDFSGIQFFVSGASAFPAENIREFEEIVGKGKLIEVCGMTETTPIIVALPRDGVKKIGSVGMPVSDTEVKLIDPESRKPVPIGEPGEIVARGPQVFTLGYHNKPEETDNTLRDGWIYTGDVAVMDEDGYFTIVDRLKDMVSVSGFKVFTRVVDDELIEHPDIDNAATIGLPDPKRPGSEIVASAVVLKSGRVGDDAMREKITAYMKEKVAPYKVPKVIQFMDALPMSAVGKVLKRELRKIMHVE
ncbi:MAG: AMP-binding protein [Syntrophales bacterium]|nr:AMP-binding protein [Syntrophales bacterium]MDD4340033.1 AMP-binding protein [Syntrophales bacterium]HOG07702.1 AMP-binding protein [Syntrophales bacterium]HOS77000.1 AMP-binding protein [Syntrophales bacterium]HPB70826.1 AMP-binding protein [Syntrophales bacterium]